MILWKSLAITLLIVIGLQFDASSNPCVFFGIRVVVRFFFQIVRSFPDDGHKLYNALRTFGSVAFKSATLK